MTSRWHSIAGPLRTMANNRKQAKKTPATFQPKKPQTTKKTAQQNKEKNAFSVAGPPRHDITKHMPSPIP
jgi:hypothetical protein